ncbi:(Fe-S)-binding protein [Propionicimonas sp.]|uniref:(Fe-S)-binding protein n=1 Tax=Propionicimonas sp. TaxID=1955623 RepID=UPI00181CCD6B|nr:(Fe-S)-binding protein [Propionicimonas sp.]MBU3977871.1 (Fe-S)-binding protein [Actinomycetota bacterium]MBA3021906.1 (Fe-S)-binding protein [Propionicimonas sp.]MBU3987648.1 (Fe-S)-binding protein [Actinomycetota bacterium]MBU4007370.1 (Fe-S)-binding protein [Actinomycetota bacterium]MBU4065684.1 (Fe-S)-binding protein [Actinomycetota bacterium]
MKVLLFVIAVAVSIAAVALFVRGALTLYRLIGAGQPSPGRLGPVGKRLGNMVTEILSHRRFRARPLVKAAHWVVMVSFILLVPTLAIAYAQVLDPYAELPIIGGWPVWQWLLELFSVGGLVAIVVLFTVRLRHPSEPEDAAGARDWRSRFFGSTRWQGYFVEAVIAAVLVCVLVMHVLTSAVLARYPETAEAGSWVHYPLTFWVGQLFWSLPPVALEIGIVVAATFKILVSMVWLGVVGYATTMSVAWHRFLGVLNVYARRETDGTPALGAAAPMLVDGKAFDIRDLDDLDEDATFGVGKIEEFGWKSLLDFASCTECGRCQDLCPAWNTGKPLSPKLFTLALRDQAAGMEHSLDIFAALKSAGAAGELAAPTRDADLVGGVISPDVLWSCTTCGACVDQCPVDIEHVDHIIDLRRHEVMVKSEFPEEFNGLFGNLETKGNPWGLPPRDRMDWAKGLDFDVPVLGTDVTSADEVDHVLWVGCAGAYDEKGKKTTRAVAELLHLAGVKFAVLGQAETCCGDSARRAGNEATYQGLATENIETFASYGVEKVVVTCAHCLNSIGREYGQLGADYRVEHHTQVLNRLIRDGRLNVVAPPEDERRQITYHDPCYLGRHNGEYDAPRELLASLPEAELVEMEHSGSSSMCCGGGGARMWTEESIGTRINSARMDEAEATGAATVATACPFCAIMLGDAAASRDQAPAVTDVAHLVLAGVKRGLTNPTNEAETES